MPMYFSVRYGQPFDFTAIQELLAPAMLVYAQNSGLDLALAQTKLSALTENSEILKDDLASARVFVGYADGKLISCLRLKETSDELASLSHFPKQQLRLLTRFAVASDYQAKGFGRGLIRSALWTASLNGLKEVYLYTATDNLILTSFYKSLGFKFISSSSERGYSRSLFKFTCHDPSMSF